jgi:isopentenyl-diphosphate delta-isomerase
MKDNQSEDLLILVDENDRELGTLGKLSVHQKGLLHRAFSIFVFNSKDELLLQQRADGKYHSEGLWTNTCCSHPRHGEKISAAVHRRLKEEMGMQCDLKFEFNFIYKMPFANGLTEHELDHVYFGRSDGLPRPDKNEVKNWKYISLPKLKEEIAFNPHHFSGWLNICLPKVMEYFTRKTSPH